MKPDSIQSDWNKHIKKEPFGYVFEFQIYYNELLADEDAIGSGISNFLNNKGNCFYKKYLTNVSNDLLKNIKKGSFEAFAVVGKMIETKLTKKDLDIIRKNSLTGTVNKTIYHKNLYKIKKPENQFLLTKEDFIEYFNKCQTN